MILLMWFECEQNELLCSVNEFFSFCHAGIFDLYQTICVQKKDIASRAAVHTLSESMVSTFLLFNVVLL